MDGGRAPFALGAAAALALAACGPRGKPSSDPRPVADDAPVPRPPGPIGLEDARRYVLALVNHDRAEHGLAAVTMDEPATAAGQRHADDMARTGFTAHWGSDGSVPEERYTAAGGVHFSQENAACFFDGAPRELDPSPMFEPKLLEQIEAAFIGETPPNDGHRKNILKEWHNGLGVGLAKPVGIDQPCMAQEFVDAYNDVEGLPLAATVGQKVRVVGTSRAPVKFGAVGVSRIDLAAPMSVEALNATSSYSVPSPAPDGLYVPAGFVSKAPATVTLKGEQFSVEVALDQGPGRYGISVFGKYPDADPLVITSLRIVTAR